MKNPAGHWWCERCQEVVHVRVDQAEPARCQGCNRDSAVFIPDTPGPMHPEPPVDSETARELFKLMKIQIQD